MQFNSTRENFEIETLKPYNYRHEGDDVYSVIDPSVDSDYPTPEIFKPTRSRHSSSKQGTKVGECSRSRFDSTSSEEDGPQQQVYITVHVNGADIGDLPTEYTVEGLRPDEFPAIDDRTYVDKRILPGFRYRVRKLGGLNTNRYLFKGKALTLQSIGRGYGKRITFEGETLNSNNNYFYSDTHPAGFGFSLVAVEEEDQFCVTGLEDIHPLAEARIVSVLEQKELSSRLDEDKNLVKEVHVTINYNLEYVSSHHCMMPIYLPQRLQATGIAMIERKHRARKANTTFIEDIEVPHHGLVVFRA